jgi:hypothetical protein
MSRQNPPGVEGVHGLDVIVHPRLHRPDDGDVVHDFRQVRQQLRHFAVAVLGKLPRRAEHLLDMARPALHE